MKPGKLDRRLTIIRRTQTGTDSHGAPIYTEAELRTVWAQKVPKSEGEQFAADQRYAVRVVTFVTRFMSDLQATDRILCEGEIFDVKGWREIGRRAGLEITAEAKA